VKAAQHLLFIIFVSLPGFSSASGGPSLPARMISIGPTFQYTFGKDCKGHFKIGFECSYWDFSGKGFVNEDGYFLPNFNSGIEFNVREDRTTIYSEYQMGLLFIGLSAGPYISYGKDDFKFGIQTTQWMYLIGVVNSRIRFSKGETEISTGGMVKVPFSPNYLGN